MEGKKLGGSKRLLRLTDRLALLLLLLSLLCPSPVLVLSQAEAEGEGDGGDGGGPLSLKRALTQGEIEAFCRNFTVGNPREKELYSPNYPLEYPSGVVCDRVLTAPPGHFVQVDFLQRFSMEPPNVDGECEYDFLEIRDGEYGYSPLIKKKHCGSKFPERVVSSGRSLWMRFESDLSIEYRGFRAAYSHIRDPKPRMANVGECSFNVSGDQVVFGHANISSVLKDYSKQNSITLDCVWRIMAEEGNRIYIKIMDYELQRPNMCTVNKIEIFDGKTDMDHNAKKFCGSITDPFTSTSHEVYVRFFAEVQGLDSKFKVVGTTFVSHTNDKPCDEKLYYNCGDSTCVSKKLECNGYRNCKFGWDEEHCDDETKAKPELDVQAAHVQVILAVLILILVGMAAGVIWKLRRMVVEDREEVAASKASLGEVGGGVSALVAGEPGRPGQVTLPGDPEKNLLVAAGSGKFKKASESSLAVPRRHRPADSSNGGCYVPDAGFPLNTGF